MKLKNVKVGQTVQLKKSAGKHTNIDEFVEVRTLGVIFIKGKGAICVKWKKVRKSYHGDTLWWCNHKEIKLIKDVEDSQ